MTRKEPPPFDEKDKIKILLWSERHCCLCDKQCDTNIEIHHIEQEGRPDEESRNTDNAIPLCYDCHGRVHSYNPKGAGGTAYRAKELKARRDQIYDKYTRGLVPLVTFNIVQGDPSKPKLSTFPKVQTIVEHRSPMLPVRARIEVKHVLNGKDLDIMKDEKGYYSGETDWHLNPAVAIIGNFSILKECRDPKDDLKIEVRLTVIDEYGRPHRNLPQAWTYSHEKHLWILEPRSFTTWTKSLPQAEPIDP